MRLTLPEAELRRRQQRMIPVSACTAKHRDESGNYRRPRKRAGCPRNQQVQSSVQLWQQANKHCTSFGVSPDVSVVASEHKAIGPSTTKSDQKRPQKRVIFRNL